MNDIRLLFVEDDATQQFALTELASNFDYGSDVVASTDEAISFLKSTKYAAILLNTEMAAANGFECAKKIRELEKSGGVRTPIVGIRSGKGEAAKKACLEAGMDDLLTTPYSGEDFRQVLLRWAYQSCSPNLRLLKDSSIHGYGGKSSPTS